MPDKIDSETLKGLVASYAGLLILVPFLTGGIKAMFKTWIENKEPIVVLFLTFALGITGKLVGLYPGHDSASWFIHIVGLIVVAIVAQGFHDKVVNPLTKKLSGSSNDPPTT